MGESFVFDGHDNFIVGRARCAHFRLPKKDRYFSRVHFMVEVNPPYCCLMDMGSTNGTRVNGQRVQAAYLNDGDLIQGGDTVLRMSLVEQPDDAVGDLACRAPAWPPRPAEPPRVEAPRVPPPPPETAVYAPNVPPAEPPRVDKRTRPAKRGSALDAAK